MGDVLTRLREHLHGEPSEEDWGGAVRAVMDAPDDGVRAVAVDYLCDLVAPRGGEWRAAATWLPGPWFAPGSDGEGGALAPRVLAALGARHVPLHRVPPGRFWMGSPPGQPGRYDDEGWREVTLTRGLLVGRTPVTLEQWARARPLPAPLAMGGHAPRLPVCWVSWLDAVAFCNALSALDRLERCYLAPGGEPFDHHHAEARVTPEFLGLDCTGWRLPTEAEWEYLCRAGNPGLTHGVLDDIAWTAANSDGAPHEVGLKVPNAWGLCDTLGNVSEWVQDAYGPLDTEAAVDPLVDPRRARHRVARGGNWSSSARATRASHRSYYTPDWDARHLGLRLVRTDP